MTYGIKTQLQKKLTKVSPTCSNADILIMILGLEGSYSTYITYKTLRACLSDRKHMLKPTYKIRSRRIWNRPEVKLGLGHSQQIIKLTHNGQSATIAAKQTRN